MRSPNWIAYGRVVFTDGDPVEAAAAFAGDGATVERLEVRDATPGEYERHCERVKRYEEWLQNVSTGTPNNRSSLN